MKNDSLKCKMNNLKIKGANMDIDLTSAKAVSWKQEECPWNKEEKIKEHKCAVKNVLICKYFKGIESPDIVICAYK